MLFLLFHIIIHSQYREHQEEYLEDNCIVFENFTASIGDLMVGYLRPLNRQLMP
jgi:hypothetical protein